MEVIDQLAQLPIAFMLFVMMYAVSSGRWRVVGSLPLSPELKECPKFRIGRAGQLSIYQELPELAPLYEWPATVSECIGLETAAVWDPEHVEDRLRDHFAG